MKASLMFRDQLTAINDWFEHWNECEQTVALYSLFKRLSYIQARFLGRVLEHSLMESLDFPLMEQQANNSVFVKNLSTEPREAAINQLLQLLPLLSPGNEEAKAQYLSLIPLLLAHSLQTGSCMEECRQLLSYSLIHPALSTSDRNSLNLWLHHMGDKLDPNSVVVGGQCNGSRLNGWKTNGHSELASQPPSINYNSYYIQQPSLQCQSQSQQQHQSLNYNHGRIRRSNSLTPPSVEAQALYIEDLSPFRAKPRSMSLSSDHAPLSPQNSLASSGSSSESRLDDSRSHFHVEGSGMKDVPSWLKSLRLHKYAYLFTLVTYEEMLGLTEEQLETQNVTKGARHKIILSIQKLKERQGDLRALEKNVVEGGSFRNALSELKQILSTPIKAFNQVPNHHHHQGRRREDQEEEDEVLEVKSYLSDNDASQMVAEGDLPGQFTRAVGKVCTQVLMSNHLDDDTFQQFQMLIDKCTAHEAFNEVQKKKLLSWKQQVQRVWHPLPPRRGSDIRHNRGRWPSHYCSTERGGSFGELGFNGVGSSVGGGSGMNLNRRRISGPYILQSSNGARGSESGCSSSSSIGGGMNGSCSGSMGSSGLLGGLGGSDLLVLDNHFAHRNSLGILTGLNAKRPTHLNVVLHPPISRAKSAPAKQIEAAQQLKNCCTDSPNDPELNNRLESLCLSVTEHALGGFG